jgi:adenylyltransferase/sulfurtransferase
MVRPMTRDLARYHRQMLLPGFGEAGQRRLLDASALILGCGALGCVAAEMLARAGVGRLTLVDRDLVELTNLQRQVLYDENDVRDGLPKAEAACRRIAAINSDVRVTAIVDDVNETNIARIAADVDILVDGLDNFETRYLANDLAVSRGIPYVYGAAVGTTGMAFPVLPHTPEEDRPWESGEHGNRATACLRCLFEEAPPPGTTPTCDTAGVVGPAVAIVANFQVAETLKILTGQYDRVNRSLLSLDLWANEILQLGTAKAYEKGDCPCCKHRRFDYLDGETGSRATVLCGSNAIQLRARGDAASIDLPAVAKRLRAHGDVRVNEFLLRARIDDNNQPYEISVFRDGRAIVQGTGDAGIARGIFAKYVGN